MGRRRGVYGLVNLQTSRLYVGSSSVDLDTRVARNFLDLDKGVHHCKPLQEAWATCGRDGFGMVVLWEAMPEDTKANIRLVEEQYRLSYGSAAYNHKAAVCGMKNMSGSLGKTLEDIAWPEPGQSNMPA